MTDKVKDDNETRSELFDWIKHIAIAVVMAIVIVNFIIQRTIVLQHSMEPTLAENDSLLIEKITPKLHLFKRGSIVTINMDGDGLKRTIIKRIIGLPGDHIEISEGKVLVNGEILEENYIKGSFTKQSSTSKYNNLIVPEDTIYVLGDNRSAMIVDSRTDGPIQYKAIQGNAFIRIYPFNKIGFIK
jgi:signal peptidase I